MQYRTFLHKNSKINKNKKFILRVGSSLTHNLEIFIWNNKCLKICYQWVIFIKHNNKIKLNKILTINIRAIVKIIYIGLLLRVPPTKKVIILDGNNNK